MKSLNEMEELKRFQRSTFDEFSRRRLIENQDTILELTARIQELQDEVNCMNDSRVFKDAESVRSGLSHVTNQPASLPPPPTNTRQHAHTQHTRTHWDGGLAERGKLAQTADVWDGRQWASFESEG